MSAGEDSVACMPLCQGFLKKRKDKIRLRWVTYWFKLHNATLFFYTKKHGSTSDLRGQYYLIEVESVQELTWPKKKHYIFEIAMKNGKRKVLAAETADLRKQWVCQLLQAMNHHVYNPVESNSSWETAPDHLSRSELSPCSQHASAEHVSFLWSHRMRSVAVRPTRTSDLYISLDTAHVESSQCAEDKVKQKAGEMEPESDYDFLPPYKPLQCEEPIYDTPPSNRRASEQEQESTESIYDVPKYVFRKKSANEPSCAKEFPKKSDLLHDMVTCLGENTAEWVRVTSPGAICQP